MATNEQIFELLQDQFEEMIAKQILTELEVEF